MDKNNRLDKSIWYAIVVASLIMSIVLFFMSGCRTVYQPYPVPEYHTIHDTVIQKSRYDSIIYKDRFVKDSSSFVQKGDTIRIERWHWERDYSYEKILQGMIDSLLSVKRDSVPYPVPGPTEYIEKPLKQWQKALIWWGVICAAIFVLILIIKIKRPKL